MQEGLGGGTRAGASFANVYTVAWLAKWTFFDEREEGSECLLGLVRWLGIGATTRGGCDEDDEREEEEEEDVDPGADRLPCVEYELLSLGA
jgi:hypothetical protein